MQRMILVVLFFAKETAHGCMHGVFIKTSHLEPCLMLQCRDVTEGGTGPVQNTEQCVSIQFQALRADGMLLYFRLLFIFFQNGFGKVWPLKPTNPLPKS